jgi:hypothetical protein
MKHTVRLWMLDFVQQLVDLSCICGDLCICTVLYTGLKNLFCLRYGYQIFNLTIMDTEYGHTFGGGGVTD